MAGRPTDLNPQISALICEVLREGCPRKAAYGCAGISETTFDKWMRRGEADSDAGLDTEHAAFVGSVERALAEGIRALCSEVRAGKGRGGPAWLLERVHWDTFGRRLAPEDRAANDNIRTTIEGIFANDSKTNGGRKKQSA